MHYVQAADKVDSIDCINRDMLSLKAFIALQVKSLAHRTCAGFINSHIGSRKSVERNRFVSGL